eukprot:m.1588014 g.1588014  ORF g.1588014 m.1588014 type:complete len:439 (-) comp25330_c0_seq6:4144-5460(-)
MKSFTVVCFCGLVMFSRTTVGAFESTPRLSPIIVVPGFAVSYLQYSLNHSNPLPNTPWCKTSTSPTWEQLSPLPQGSSLDDLACYVENMKMQPNPHSIHPPFIPSRVNMSVRPWEFGSFNSSGTTLSDMVARLVSDGWSTENYTLACAPYDFRVPPDGLNASLFVMLKDLVERMYISNGNTSTTLWALSDGTPYILAFLQSMPDEWKDQYIGLFVADSPVWSGTVSPLLTFTSGYIPGFNRSSFDASIACSLARGFPSTPWLFPRVLNTSQSSGDAAYLWGPNETIVTTPNATYTAANYSLLLRDLGIASNESLETLARVALDTTLSTFEAPGVNTVVVVGSDVPTPVGVSYPSPFDAALACSCGAGNITYGNGDGVVPHRSAQRSQVWAAAQRARQKILVHLEYQDLRHVTCSFPQSGPTADACYHDVLTYVMNSTA